MPSSTVKDYYQILQDTLLGFELLPWDKSKKRKAIQTAKFYFFDLGVTHTLLEIEHLEPKSNLYGQAFEHFIGNELRAYISYNRLYKPLTFWRSTSQIEVDYVVGDEIAIEVKATKRATKRDHKGLLALSEEKKWKHLFLVSQDESEMKFDNGIRHLPWQKFLESLWAGEIL